MPRETSPGRRAHERPLHPDGQREAAKPSNEGAAFDDSETELRLAAWLNSLGEDESPEEAGGR